MGSVLTWRSRKEPVSLPCVPPCGRRTSSRPSPTLRRDRLDAALFDIRTTVSEEQAAGLRQGLAAAFVPIEKAGAGAVAADQNIIGDVVP